MDEMYGCDAAAPSGFEDDTRLECVKMLEVWTDKTFRQIRGADTE